MYYITCTLYKGLLVTFIAIRKKSSSGNKYIQNGKGKEICRNLTLRKAKYMYKSDLKTRQTNINKSDLKKRQTNMFKSDLKKRQTNVYKSYLKEMCDWAVTLRSLNICMNLKILILTCFFFLIPTFLTRK